MPKPDSTVSFFARFRGWIVGLTGVFIVVPALINAGSDIYAALLKLPRTESERINERLFREYFKKQPVATFPVPIKQNNEIVEVSFAIYDKGDVFVEFGNFTQWFPFPAGEEKKGKIGLSLISSAIAQTPSPAKGEGRYLQMDRIEGDAVVRQKTFENGVIEKQVIDPRSGDILNSSVHQGVQPPVVLPPPAATSMPKIAPVDLDQYRKAAQSAPSSPAGPSLNPGVSTPSAQDPLEALKTSLAWCRRKENFFSRGLCEYRERRRACDAASPLSKSRECSG